MKDAERELRTTIRRQLAQARAAREEAEFQCQLAVLIVLAIVGGLALAAVFSIGW